jgi:hypothetical protein
MARTYKRDKNGRFSGTGAGKREAQTMRSRSKPSGTISAKSPSTKALQIRTSRGDKAAMARLIVRRAKGRIGKESGFGPKPDTPPLRADGSVRQRMQVRASAKPSGTIRRRRK